MPECNCTINKEYIYNEFTLKTEKLTKLINNDFVVKLTYDLLDNDKNILLNFISIIIYIYKNTTIGNRTRGDSLEVNHVTITP